MNELVQKNEHLENELQHLRNYRRDHHYRGSPAGVQHENPHPHPAHILGVSVSHTRLSVTAELVLKTERLKR